MVQQHSEDVERWLRLKGADGVGPATFLKLLENFGSVDKALGASVSEMMKIDGIGGKKAERIFATRNIFNVKEELELADKFGVSIITIEDSRYPTLLRKVTDPPVIIYVKGTIEKKDNVAIAIVGSRRCSLYGQEQSSRFAFSLASAGFTVCSGMARGIDTAAHKGALSTGGRTLAVQGCGLSRVFPPENEELFKQIAENGACISELPMKTEPLADNFPARNRIIAGLSLGTIVIEAGLNSGGLLTAKAAVDYNREVMAIPGKIDSPLNKGSHKLIKEGARLIESIEDVMDCLGYIGQQLKNEVVENSQRAVKEIEMPLFDASQLNLSKNEGLLLDCLGKEPIHIEQIIEESDLSPGSINSGLVSLQLKGLIKQLPGSMFVRR